MSLNKVYETLFINLLIGLIVITAYAIKISSNLGFINTRLMNTVTSATGN